MLTAVFSFLASRIGIATLGLTALALALMFTNMRVSYWKHRAERAEIRAEAAEVAAKRAEVRREYGQKLDRVERVKDTDAAALADLLNELYGSPTGKPAGTEKAPRAHPRGKAP